jgi:hypothetical protein
MFDRISHFSGGRGKFDMRDPDWFLDLCKTGTQKNQYADSLLLTNKE